MLPSRVVQQAFGATIATLAAEGEVPLVYDTIRMAELNDFVVDATNGIGTESGRIVIGIVCPFNKVNIERRTDKIQIFVFQKASSPTPQSIGCSGVGH